MLIQQDHGELVMSQVTCSKTVLTHTLGTCEALNAFRSHWPQEG